MFWADNYNLAVGLFNEYKASREKSTLEKAIQKFEESANVDTTQGPTYSLLAACYSELGNEELAVHNARKAREIMPDDFQSNLALGQILSRTGNEEESVTFVKKAIDIDPSNTVAIRKLAVLYYELGDTVKSVETFEAAIKTETDKMRKSNLYFNLGVLNKQLNNFEEAEIAFEEAFYLNDKDYEAIRGMAEAYEELGDNYRLGKDGFEKNPSQSARWYRKAEKKFKFILDIDLDNESTYKKYIEQLRYKRNIVENN
jgi:tetratricopeptide (TPR) repeat protein